jgi:YNFM family putative membrane transporter
VVSGRAAFLYLFAYYLGSSVCGTLAGPAGSLSDWPTVTALALALFLACGLLIAWLWHVSFLDKPAFPDGVLRGALTGPSAAAARGCDLADTARPLPDANS